MGNQKYTQEFRESAVKLVLEQQQTVAAAAASLGMPHNTLVAWVIQARKGRGQFAPQGEQDLAAKVRALEAENRRLRMERDILKKATALFAQEERGLA
jgi:transposase